MWPTQFVTAVAPNRWSDRSVRSRLLAILGIVALLLVASFATWLSIRGGQPASPTLYGTAQSVAGAAWTWDGSGYTQVAARGAAPTSNEADMAYDRARGVIVLWDHGCANLVMGFQGGCIDKVNRTWTWDGKSWTQHSTKANPTAAGRGAMLFDSRLGQVVYVNGVGQAWTWTGTDWTGMAMPGGPQVPRNLGFAAGYDEVRNALVFALPAGTWSWDGARWTAIGDGIQPGEASADAHIVFDRAYGRLVYVGSRYTWTWEGGRWNPHDQPAITGGTAAYDSARAAVMLVRQDSAACDRSACRTATWSLSSTGWTRQEAAREAQAFPLTRSGAYAAPMAFDEARGVAVLFISAS